MKAKAPISPPGPTSTWLLSSQTSHLLQSLGRYSLSGCLAEHTAIPSTYVHSSPPHLCPILRSSYTIYDFQLKLRQSCTKQMVALVLFNLFPTLTSLGTLDKTVKPGLPTPCSKIRRMQYRQKELKMEFWRFGGMRKLPKGQDSESSRDRHSKERKRLSEKSGTLWRKHRHDSRSW